MDGHRQPWVASSVPTVLLSWAVISIFRFAHHITYNFPARFETVALIGYYGYDALRWALFTLFALWFVRCYPADAMKRSSLWTVIAPLLLISTAAMLALDAFIFQLAGPSLGLRWPKALFDLVQKRFHRMLLDVTTVLIVSYGIGIQRTLAAEALRNAKLESAVTQARLAVLTQRLQPHLLYNTLNSIAGLIHRQPRTAELMLARLGDVLRAVLRVGGRNTIPLGEDLALADAFLRIHEHRFPAGLRAEVDIPDELLNAAVPPLLLQPFVENSVKHGLADGIDSATIWISAMKIDGQLLVEVRDAGRGSNAPAKREGFGIGFQQIRERLASMYGSEASVVLRSTPEEGTTVSLRLPFRIDSEDPEP